MLNGILRVQNQIKHGQLLVSVPVWEAAFSLLQNAQISINAAQKKHKCNLAVRH